jgi:hypoxanthine phosphoribosyltransferase
VVEWPLFGELSRALALKVAREYDPELVVGVATAGVVPGAVIAAILDRQFASITVSRRFRATTVRATPAIIGAAPAEVRGRRVLIVDETCGSGATLASRERRRQRRRHGGAHRRGFKTGAYAPDFHALATEAAIVLPWDREVLVDGELTPNPAYEGML